jgi:AGCS family alanine or glycine:cation symporter
MLEAVLDAMSDVVWGPYVLVPLLLLTGVHLTVRLGGLQFRRLGAALRLALVDRQDEDAEGGDVSQFQALTTALAATIGTGNIVGVAAAISIGGPGALFWMWVTGLLGMAAKYAEAFLAVRFRTTDARGEMSGGPQYYLARGIPNGLGRFLALFFAVAAALAAFGIGNMSQGNSIAANLESSFGVPAWATGAVLTGLTLVVLLGGIRSIGRLTAGLVPLMILCYVLGALFILAANAAAVPQALVLVVTDAFTGTAAAGGFAGSALALAVQTGIARGSFSHESGMGSASIAAAAARTTHPVRQGLVAMTQTFVATLVISCTGLVIITTGEWTQGPDFAATMTGDAFAHGLPGQWGHYVVTVGLVMFAYSTIIGWAYYGERCMERLFGAAAVVPYRVVFSLVVFVGCTVPLALVWSFADVMNGLMALPNVLGLFLLSGLVARETKHYLRHDPELRAGKEQIDAFMRGRPGAVDAHEDTVA